MADAFLPVFLSGSISECLSFVMSDRLLPWCISKHYERCWCNVSLMHNVYPKCCCLELRRTPIFGGCSSLFVCVHVCGFYLKIHPPKHYHTCTTEKGIWMWDYLPKCFSETISLYFYPISSCLAKMKPWPSATIYMTQRACQREDLCLHAHIYENAIMWKRVCAVSVYVCRISLFVCICVSQKWNKNVYIV